MFDWVLNTPLIKIKTEGHNWNGIWGGEIFLLYMKISYSKGKLLLRWKALNNMTKIWKNFLV